MMAFVKPVHDMAEFVIFPYSFAPGILQAQNYLFEIDTGICNAQWLIYDFGNFLPFVQVL